MEAHDKSGERTGRPGGSCSSNGGFLPGAIDGSGVVLLVGIALFGAGLLAVAGTGAGTAGDAGAGAGTPSDAVASHTTNVTSCTTIDVPGRYNVTADITYSGNDPCFEITTDNVTLTTIDRSAIEAIGDAERYTAVDLGSVSNVTIRNLSFRNFGTAVRMFGTNDSLVDGISTATTTRYSGTGSNGIVLVGGATNNTIRDVFLATPGHDSSTRRGENGIKIRNSDNNRVIDNEISVPDYAGIRLYGASGNNVTGNEISGNALGQPAPNYGIQIGFFGQGESNDNYVARNDVSGESTHGRFLSGMGDGILIGEGFGNELVDNLVRGVYGRGIMINDGNTTIHDNTLRDNGKEGIVVFRSASNPNVTDNFVSTSGQAEQSAGISISTDTAPVNDNEVRDNRGVGFLFEGAHVAARDNSVEFSQGWVELQNASADIDDLNDGIDATGRNFTLGGAISQTPPPGQRDIGTFVDATNTSQDASLLLNVSYDNEDANGIFEDNLSMWRYESGSWSEVDDGVNDVNTTANEVFARIDSFSTFAPLGPPPTYEVNVTGTNSPVEANKMLTVEAGVNNTQNSQDTQTVTLRDFGGTVVDSQSVTLGPNNSTIVTLAWQTGSGDIGSDEVVVQSDQGEASESVAVLGTTPVSGEPISDCTTIVRPGSYVVTSDISFSPDDRSDTPCIEVLVGDVEIDGQGHLLEGAPSTDGGTGVLVAGSIQENVTVRNLELRNVSSGVRIGSVAANGTVSDLTVDSLLFRNLDSTIDGGGVDADPPGDNATLQNVTIRDSRFVNEGFSYPAIAVRDVGGNATVEGLRVENTSTDDGISQALELSSGEDGTIADVRVSNSSLRGHTLVDVNTGERSTVRGLRITDSTVNGSSVGVEVGYRQDATVKNVLIADSVINSQLGTAIQFDARGNTGVETRNVTIRNNEITAEPAGGRGVEADISLNNGNVVVEGFDVVDNRIDSTYNGVLFWGFGDDSTYEMNVTGNTILGFSGQGIRAITNVQEAPTSIDIADNAIRSDEASDVIGVELTTGTDFISPTDPEGTINVTANAIRTAGDAVEIASNSEWLETIDISQNVLETSAFGVDNQASSPDGTTWVNATENYWGNSTGPNSTGPYSDPVTGTLANGSGSAVSGSSGVANVHFDPWLSSSPLPTPNLTVAIDSTNSPVTARQSLVVNATVENTDGTLGTQTVALSVDGTDRNSTDVSVAGGASAGVSLAWDPARLVPGNYTAAISTPGDTDTTNVTIQQPIVSDYANESQIVDINGLLDAIDDWRDGIVDTTRLLDVIDAWRRGKPV